ncbi:ABC transporter permease [Bremerella cremea]|uniref:ABC transporter permease n=1 Tax=Bremerella cremea TaxID=1031537 RepID=UPI0031E8C287
MDSLEKNDPYAAALPPIDKYRDMYNEAKSIRGISLWQDAWRRLRRDWVSMTALCFLICLALAAIFTPLLPLQSPREQYLATRVALPPQFSSTTKTTNEAGDDETVPVSLNLADLEGEEFERRVGELWSEPSPFDRVLLSVRLALFHDWCMPSLCGTDLLGRDLMARLFYGARVSLIVGLVATLVSLIIGVSYGAIAGYSGGIVDDFMMRIVDIMYSVPFIFLVLFVITILSEDSVKAQLESYGISRIVILYILIGAVYWLTMARVVRGQIISLKNEQFVDAARTIGASGLRIVFLHLVPNVLSIVIVYLTLTIPAVMLFEAFLSFLGLGVEPPDVSWGMLSEEGTRVITPVKIYWWLIVFPALALASTLYSLNFLGDGLRDALDPRMKNR